MHGSIRRWWGGMLVLAAIVVGPANAPSQDGMMPGPIYAAADESLPGEMAGGDTVATDGLPASDLAKRVADLENAMKKAAEKEAEAKTKAAAKPTINVGGRVFLDWALFNQSAASRADLGDAQDATFFRTARLHAEGEMFDVFEYKIEMDFAGRDDADLQRTLFKDVYLGVKDLPMLGRLRVGHFKEPFSLEELTSARFISFMERGLPNALVPQRNVGVMSLNHNESQTVTWAFGAFRQLDENPPFRQDDGGSAFTARATWLPWYDEPSEGRGLLHLGLAYRYLDFDNPVQRVRQRPEINVGPRVVDTGNFGNNVNAHFVGPEVAFVYGPFSAQAELVASQFERTGGSNDANFNGMYVYVSYFLTGENRAYKRSEGRFDRIKPLENFFRVRTGDGDVGTGRGAWEVLYRYSNLDLQNVDAAVLGGYAADHTFGLNWYLNPNMRIMWNYIHTEPSLLHTEPMDIFAMRAQFDF